MKRLLLTTAVLAAMLTMDGFAAEPALTFTKVWTHNHGTAAETPGQLSEVPAFDQRTNTIWVVGIVGVDVLDAATGERVGHIDVTSCGSVNSVSIHNGLAALAVEAAAQSPLSNTTGRARPGRVLLYDTKTRELAKGVNIRANTGMDFEPEYIAVTQDGTKAYVTLQEGNAIGVIDLTTNTVTQVIGLGAKNFSLEGNEIDPLNDGSVPAVFGTHAAKGLYMPDSIAAYQCSARPTS